MTTLHIYGQAGYHDDIYIAGDQRGLLLLAQAIIEALAAGHAEREGLSVSDGEGFNVRVMHISPPEELIEWAAPYTADYARDYRSDLCTPEEQWVRLGGKP